MFKVNNYYIQLLLRLWWTKTLSPFLLSLSPNIPPKPQEQLQNSLKAATNHFLKYIYRFHRVTLAGKLFKMAPKNMGLCGIGTQISLVLIQHEQVHHSDSVFQNYYSELGKYSWKIISFFFYYAGVLDRGLTCGVDWNELYSDETVY